MLSTQKFPFGAWLAALLLVITPWQVAMASQCAQVHRQASKLAMAEVFKQAFQVSTQVYRAGECGLNVKKLILFLTQKGVVLDQASVLFLLSEKRIYSGIPVNNGPLEPAWNRNWEKSWDFHVVLRMVDQASSEAIILDLDYKPVAVPILRYFSDMFPNLNTADRLSNIQLREIDPASYLQGFQEYRDQHQPGSLFDENTVVGKFRNPDLSGFPIQSVRQYLNKLNE